MATATKKRPAKKSVKKKAARKVVKKAPVPKASAKPGKNGAAVHSAGPGKFAANQPPLVGMEDVDERVPALDEVCQKVLADKSAYASKAQDISEGLEKVGELLEEHNLDCYIISGKKFAPVAGEPTVKIYKVKQG
jgi:hypothetical protein